MTLARQLFIGLSIIFALLVLGIETIFVQNARRYLQQQLDANAQETATSLALSLGLGMKAPDAALAQALINPIFDRGHFASIRLLDVEGKPIVVRELADARDEIPAPIKNLLPFDAPTGEALVSSGWRQLGRVMVVAHPGFAYGQLWHTMLETLAWLIALYVLALLSMVRFLSGILRPLEAIEQAALAISRREFGEVKISARTRELQRVSHAMNELSVKLRDAISKESARADQLHQEAFHDPLTATLNRRGLIQQVQGLLSEGGVSSGALAFVSMIGLEEINRTLGAAKGDELVRQLGEVVGALHLNAPGVVGRWQGASFALFMPNRDLVSAGEWGNSICSRFSGLLREQSIPVDVAVAAGLVHFDAQHPSWADLERQAGQALAEATQRGEASCCVVRPMAVGDSDARSADEWRGLIEQALASGSMVLYAQKVFVLAGGQVLHAEIMSRLRAPDGHAVAAGAFVPAASRLHLLPLIDHALLEHLWIHLEQSGSLPASVAVNVSAQSLEDSAFRQALRERLARSPAIARRVVFELSGYAVVHNLELTAEFAAEVRGAGARFAIDGFELSGASLRAAHRLLPEYVKLAESYSRGIAAHADLRYLVESLIRIVHPLEIKLIASNVEDPAILDQLRALGFDGFQGYAGDRPSPL